MLVLVLAFQVWDLFGWAGQGIFTWRMLQQWWASERARRSVLPAAFWGWSLAGTALQLVYQLHRWDVVFLAGVLVNGALYTRNLVLLRRAPAASTGPGGSPAAAARPPGSPLPAVLLALAVLGAGVVLSWEGLAGRGALLGEHQPLGWMLVGGAGQVAWSSRFVLQWWLSERRGRSVLPPAFFWLSLVGALLLGAYAVWRRDYVMMAAFALNPVPYVRNLVLIHRERVRAAERADS